MKPILSALSLLLSLSLLALLSACSKDNPESDDTGTLPPPVEQPYLADSYLPGDNPTYDLERLEPLTTIVAVEPEGDTALGHSLRTLRHYRFIGQTRTTYRIGPETLSLEISQFATVPDAYGYFAHQRPFDAPPLGLGKDSWADSAHVWFVDGHCVVTMSSTGESSGTLSAQSILAREVEAGIPVTEPLPIFIKMFPDRDRIFGSTRYDPIGFLKIRGLDEAYSTLYDIDGDTVIFFMVFDTTGESFVTLQKHARRVGTVSPAPDTLSFPEPAWSLAYNDPAHGPIVAGMVRKKLVGIVGWDHSRLQWLGHIWILGLK